MIERLYGNSHLLNDSGQYAYYGRVGGCIVTGNEDGVKHCALETLYALQHLGYTIPPQADAGWIGEVGPGPSYLDEGSGGPQNDFTNRNTTFMTWNLMHVARMLRDAGARKPAHGVGRGLSLRLPQSRLPVKSRVSARACRFALGDCPVSAGAPVDLLGQTTNERLWRPTQSCAAVAGDHPRT